MLISRSKLKCSPDDNCYLYKTIKSTETMASFTNQIEVALYQFAQLPVSSSMISYLAQKTSQIVPRISYAVFYAAPPISETELPPVLHFIKSVVKNSHVRMPTLMTSLVYLSRLRSYLSPTTKGMPCSAHRIFLASLILAAKNVNDTSPKNKHWARYSAVPGYEAFRFSLTEVNLMERQLLHLLNWDLRINLEDLYHQVQPLLMLIRVQQPLELNMPDLENITKTQQYLNPVLEPRSGSTRYK